MKYKITTLFGLIIVLISALSNIYFSSIIIDTAFYTGSLITTISAIAGRFTLAETYYISSVAILGIMLYALLGFEYLSWLFIVLNLITLVYVAAHKPTRKKKTMHKTEEMVVTTKTSQIFHRPRCSLLRKTRTSNLYKLRKKEALKKGYNACKTCLP